MRHQQGSSASQSVGKRYIHSACLCGCCWNGFWFLLVCCFVFLLIETRSTSRNHEKSNLMLFSSKFTRSTEEPNKCFEDVSSLSRWVVITAFCYVMNEGRHCFVFQQDECYNYVKVLVPRNDETLFACGTNAFNPTCRNYKVNTPVLCWTWRVLRKEDQTSVWELLSLHYIYSAHTFVQVTYRSIFVHSS